MSAPIDTPHNIQIHVQHTERVVQPEKPQPGKDFNFETSIGLENRKQGKEKEKKISREGDKKKREDWFDRQQKTKDDEEHVDTINKEPRDSEEKDSKQTDIGNMLDISI